MALAIGDGQPAAVEIPVAEVLRTPDGARPTSHSTSHRVRMFDLHAGRKDLGLLMPGVVTGELTLATDRIARHDSRFYVLKCE